MVKKSRSNNKSKKNNDDKFFQYTVTVTLNYEQIKKDPQRISKNESFSDQYNWKEIDFLSHKKT